MGTIDIEGILGESFDGQTMGIPAETAGNMFPFLFGTTIARAYDEGGRSI